MKDAMVPAWTSTQPDSERGRRHRRWHVLALLVGAALAFQAYQATTLGSHKVMTLPLHAQESLAKCRSLHVTPGPPDDFHQRKVSDRFVPGTKPVLLRNAHIWTVRLFGSPSDNAAHMQVFLGRK
jgi:hypothetical protein